MEHFSRHNQKGYIALIAVLIITAVTLAISLSMNTVSIGETESGLIKQQSAQSFAFADGCMQEAYLRLKRDNSYTSGNLNVEDGSCKISIAKASGDYIITVDSNFNNIGRRLESAVAIIGNNLTVQYWKELSK